MKQLERFDEKFGKGHSGYCEEECVCGLNPYKQYILDMLDDLEVGKTKLEDDGLRLSWNDCAQEQNKKIEELKKLL